MVVNTSLDKIELFFSDLHWGIIHFPEATMTTTVMLKSNVKLLAATTSTVTENAGTEGNATSDGDLTEP